MSLELLCSSDCRACFVFYVVMFREFYHAVVLHVTKMFNHQIPSKYSPCIFEMLNSFWLIKNKPWHQKKPLNKNKARTYLLSEWYGRLFYSFSDMLSQVSAIEQDIIEVDPDTKEMLKVLVSVLMLHALPTKTWWMSYTVTKLIINMLMLRIAVSPPSGKTIHFEGILNQLNTLQCAFLFSGFWKHF